MTYRNFRLRTLRAVGKKKFKITHSYGTKQGWRYLKKNKWFSGEPVTEKQFGSIIRRVNELLIEQFLKGSDIVFPYKMGKLELRKMPASIRFEDGELKTNLPVDWKRTLQLWYEDEEAKNNKTLIRKEYKEVFRIIYNKSKAVYKNKCFYNFIPNRDFKKKLSDSINNNETDAFLRYRI